MRILVVHYGKITGFPPVISLVSNLLRNNHKVTVISDNLTELPTDIISADRFKGVGIKSCPRSNRIMDRAINVMTRGKQLRELVSQEMNNNDLIWTTTDVTARELGDILFQYKHIMQLMELVEDIPLMSSQKIVMAHLDKIARRAYKVVVPEQNRAYIQKIWWNLSETPSVLPNKPYIIGECDESRINKNILNKLQNEKRKIILYQGSFGKERNLKIFAEAIKEIGAGEYAFYIMGNDFQTMKQMCTQYPFIEYLGFITPPDHLAVAKYAYIGLLPYVPSRNVGYCSELNALYCAPNKIYEYALCSLPMVGTDVLGLRYPFEKYDIGVCCKHLEIEDIIEAIKYVEENHERMSRNCKTFFDDTDLDKIVEEIIS